MRELFETVMALQARHSSQNTPEMMERGKLIRDAIPAEMREWSAAKAAALLPFRGRLNVQGRDGTGLKTFVPWVRIHSPEMSPSAQSGWYVVYLFRSDGEGVALCISHGSTRFDGRDFKPRSASEATQLMAWGRAIIGPQAKANGMIEGVDLGSSKRLSKAYESTTAFSKTYDRANLPDDITIAADAVRAVSLIGELYRAQELGAAPFSEPPEIIEAMKAVENISRPRPSGNARSGQGFGLDAAERAAVEERAMDEALSWLSANGFTNVRDVHATHSCDFLADRATVEHHIEVKGTTSEFGKIILTANEVELHRAAHPANVLIVVHGIRLHETRRLAYGGKIAAFDPWCVNDCTLLPLSFVCHLIA
jgi:hypothetical protein